MRPALSVYLNAARIAAALVVLVSHWATATFTDGRYAGLKSLWLGTDGVVLFFVLSGVVIAYTSETKDRTLASFAFNRATRMYSVVLPAIVLTLGLDALGNAIDSAFYARSWRWDTPIAGQIWSALTFSVDVWFNRDRLGTNGPLWSLSYEVWYYIIFACLYYLRGPNRVFSVAIFVLLIGSSIPLLMPCWLLGVWVYHVSKAPPESAFVGWTAVVLPIVLYLLLQDSGWLVSLGRLPLAVLGPKEASYLFGNAQFALREYVVSCLAAIHFIGIATVLKSRKPLAAQWINWAAGATFSLYVTHAPVLHFVKAVVPDHTWLYLPICIAVALAFAWAFERRLASFRRLVLAILPGYDVVRKIPGAEAA